MANFDRHTSRVLEFTCAHSNLSLPELIGGSRKKNVVLARCAAATYLRNANYSLQLIADNLGVDVSIVHKYVHSHENRMADKFYSNLYLNIGKSMSTVEEIQDDSTEGQLEDLRVRLATLESRVKHLTTLITE